MKDKPGNITSGSVRSWYTCDEPGCFKNSTFCNADVQYCNEHKLLHGYGKPMWNNYEKWKRELKAESRTGGQDKGEE